VQERKEKDSLGSSHNANHRGGGRSWAYGNSACTETEATRVNASNGSNKSEYADASQSHHDHHRPMQRQVAAPSMFLRSIKSKAKTRSENSTVSTAEAKSRISTPLDGVADSKMAKGRTESSDTSNPDLEVLELT
jgi:hypothetical protein